MIAITGASGQLGRLVIKHLLKSIPAAQLVAVVRSPEKLGDLASAGLVVRGASYDDPASLDRAFAGVERVLLVSSNEIGRRVAQHRNVIEAARRQGVKLLAMTSLLHADISPLSLAGEYRQSEELLKASGVPFVILRNGWYMENHTVFVPAAVAGGELFGSADEGRISWATRADLAEAAASVLVDAGTAGRTYELSGDESYRLADLAAEISRQTGTRIPYKNLPEAEFRDYLLGAGLPAPLAEGFASWDVCASKGALFDEGHELRDLIGRPTTPMQDVVRAALALAAEPVVTAK